MRAAGILVVYLVMPFNHLFSQINLVPNYSFESYIVCPVGAPSSNYYEPFPWFNPTINTPDYYNQCNLGSAGVPCNWTGCQNARTGVGYSGGAMLYPSQNAREYIEIKLLSPLVAARNYCVEFYVSLAGPSNIAIDRLGCYLSADSVFSNNLFYLPYQPQIENPQGNILSDTNNWMLVSGLYPASGGEKFITIGNFYPDSLTAIDTVNGNPGIWSYYYIDDVRVYCCDADSCIDKILPPFEEDLFIPNAFSPNGDGNNEFFHVLTNYPDSMFTEFKLQVYDRWGEQVYSVETVTPSSIEGWDGSFKGKALDQAVFVYYFEAKLTTGESVSRKGNITLIR